MTADGGAVRGEARAGDAARGSRSAAPGSPAGSPAGSGKSRTSGMSENGSAVNLASRHGQTYIQLASNTW